MISDNVVVCITHDAMTMGGRRLRRRRRSRGGGLGRRNFQSTLREDLVSGIEMLTGRKVLCFMSDHDADHDYAAEVFVLDAAPGEQARSAEPESRLES